MRRNLSHYDRLHEKWSASHKALEKEFRQKHKDIINLLPKEQIIGTLMLASVPLTTLTPPITSAMSATPQQEVTKVSKNEVIAQLKELLPPNVQPLTPEEETKVAEYLSNAYGVKVSPQLNDIRLNRSYGLIGKEQHLARFPGDNMSIHFDSVDEASHHGAEGMAPGLGAWGYFAKSQAELTEEVKQKERYYIAVPTFLAPGFNDNVGRYRDFFKHRKMLLVNPENGKAIVADIGDAGPAQWTGKHLGGSPEVMHYLERVDGAARGPVLYYFLEDDTIPLGPIEI